MLGALVMMIVSFGVGVRDARDGDAMRRLAPVVVLSSVGLLLLAATMAARVLSHNFYAKGLAEPLVTFAAALALGALWPELGGLALAPLIAACIVVAIAWRGVRALYNARAVVAHARRGPLDPELVRFALPLAASEFLNILAMRLGSFVLIAYAGPIDRAVFNTALLLAGTISYLRGLFDTVLGPLAAEAWAAGQPERVAANLKAQTRSVLVFAAPYASLFIVAGDALLALYGDGFVAGHRAMIWLAVGHIINATLGLTGWVLMAAHRTRAMLVNNVAKIALEIALCVALIPYLGIEGAALATCAAIAVLQSLQVYEVYRLAGIHPFSRGLLWCALGGAAMIVAELAVVHALESQLTRQVLAPIVVVVGGGAYIATILLSSRRTRA
jgi:O-antigen/teichoic acid export membrane protein